jgi:hypothetical protein
MSEAPTEFEDRLSRALADQAKRIDVSIPGKPELTADRAKRRSRNIRRPSGAAVGAAAAIAVCACIAVFAVVLLGHDHVAPISQAQTSHQPDHNRSAPTRRTAPSTIPAAIRPFAKILAVLRRPRPRRSRPQEPRTQPIRCSRHPRSQRDAARNHDTGRDEGLLDPIRASAPLRPAQRHLPYEPDRIRHAPARAPGQDLPRRPRRRPEHTRRNQGRPSLDHIRAPPRSSHHSRP